MTAAELAGRLHRRYPADRWLWAQEVQLPGALGNRRLDAFAISCWPSDQHARHAFEIKISRSDLRRELHDPAKTQFALDVAEHVWFCCAPGITDGTDLPPGTGLLVPEGDDLRVVRPAPHRTIAPPSTALLVAVGRQSTRPTGPVLPAEATWKELIAALGEPGDATRHLLVRLQTQLHHAGARSMSQWIHRHLARVQSNRQAALMERLALWGVPPGEEAPHGS